MNPRKFVFLKTDRRGRTRDSDRKLIRSQCMNGKNLRIGRHLTKDVNENTTNTVPERDHVQQRKIDQPSSTGADKAEVRLADLVKQLSQLPISGGLRSDLSLLADNTDAQARLHLLHFLTHASHVLYPVELCVDFDLEKSNGVRWIFEDAAYLHFTLFFCSAINDVYRKLPFGKTTYHHLGRTITALNDKITGSNIEDSTVSVISSLVIVTAMFTDYNAARAHFAGLQQIVRLRGGLEGFRHNLNLYIKLARVDLAYNLHTGQPPLFGYAGLSPLSNTDINAPRPYQEGSAAIGGDDYSSLDAFYTHPPEFLQILAVDQRVADIFSDLRYLSCRLNDRRRLQDNQFKSAICSIQYRILSLENTPLPTMSETIRLAMLVFLTTTFEIPERAGQRYPYLTKRFRESCCALFAESSRTPVWDSLAMWLLVIGGVSLYGLGEPWLRERWKQVVRLDEPWLEAREKLRKFLWIDSLHDRLGQKMMDGLYRMEVEGVPDQRTKTVAWWMSGWGVCPFEA